VLWVDFIGLTVPRKDEKSTSVYLLFAAETEYVRVGLGKAP
jgi:hypothetical protein